MKREEILAKAQKENNGRDLADEQAQKDASRIAYTVGIVALIIVEAINRLVLGSVNAGADFAMFTMAFVAFLVKYVKLRKKHELFVMLIWGTLSVGMLVLWILQLCGVI